MNFDHILNWKLLAGSHKFPGPDGGTCINEAAIVAAGFKYRSVATVEDCPPCFSRVIAAYAIRLNDAMPNGLRQLLLLPFVTRLAGTADTPEKESERMRHIVVQTVKRIVPISLRIACLEDAARRCEETDSLITAHAASRAAAATAFAAGGYAASAASATVYHATARATYATAHATYATARATRAPDIAVSHAAAAAAAAATAFYAADHAAFASDHAAFASAKIFTIAVTILDEALHIGRQSQDLEVALVAERMARAKKLEGAM